MQSAQRITHGVSSLLGLVRRSHALKLSISLSMLVLCMLFVSDLLALRGNASLERQNARKVISESLAVQLSTLVAVAQAPALQHAVLEFVSRNEDVEAVVLRRSDAVVVASGGNQDLIGSSIDGRSTPTSIVVPLYSGKQSWGEVRIAFKSLNRLVEDFVFFGFVILGCLFVFFVFLRRALMQLDPSRAVPGRVDSAFNLFCEGVVIMDAELRILLSNRSAANMINDTPECQLGKRLDDWPWVKDEQWYAPWRQAVETGMGTSEHHMYLDTADGQRLVVVSCTLVGGQSGERRGVMVTLNDMSALQKKNQELSATLNRLEQSQRSIAEKNLELESLASTDPLSGLKNRRAFMTQFTQLHESAIEHGTPIVCLMLDIDHFKNINDTYGHGVGDDVICAVANCLQENVRHSDIVGRYGGEEFVVAMPETTLSEAAALAEKLREGVVELASQDVLPLARLSGSFGLCDFEPEEEFRNVDTLLMLSDKALYAAKGAGRNRVVCYCPDTLRLLEASSAEDNGEAQASNNDSDDAACAIEDDVLLRNGGSAIESQGSVSERADVVQEIMARHVQEVETLKSHDLLTQLPKRQLFIQAIDNEISRAQRTDAVMGIVSIEIKDANLYSASLGQQRSDRMIKQVVDHVQEGLRASDRVVRICDDFSLSKMADNQFGILLSDLAGVDHILPALMRIRRLLLDPVDIDGMTVHPGYNIGIAVYPQCGESAATLIENAVDARIQASGLPEKVAYHFASSDVAEKSREYIALESDLYKAVRQGLLQVHFQPKFDLVSRRISSVEALVRWFHPERGAVPPDRFILIAESNGLIREIFNHVLEKSLEQLMAWDRQGLGDIGLSVNLSGSQLRDKRLTKHVLSALSKSGISSDRLDLELTETAIIQAPDRARQILTELGDAGISVSMDDFGTGYTSLALLAELPLRNLKIDRSLVCKLGADARTHAVIESVISMAHALQLRVIAEGVEAPEQLNALHELGCDEIQGYLICRPMAAEQLTPMLLSESELITESHSLRRTG